MRDSRYPAHVPPDDALEQDPTLNPEPSEDDYSGRDGGTPNAEAVRAAEIDPPTASSRDDGAQVPEEVRSPTPPPQDP